MFVSQTTNGVVVVEEKNKKAEDVRISSEEELEIFTSLTRKISKLEIEFDKTGNESLLKEIKELKRKRRNTAPRVESEIAKVATRLDYIWRDESPYPRPTKK
jgi:type II secretory pathway component PulC